MRQSRKPGKLTLGNGGERGQSLMLFTLVCVLVVIPVIGLAIDGSILFWVKAKLSAAVDAAALAAGRNPTANLNTTVLQYVNANFPPGWMGTTFTAGPTGVPSNPSLGTRQVTVTASVAVPLRFMSMLGFKQSTVSAVAVSSRRNTNVILVLDRSGSMNIIGPDGALVCNTMIASATTFVNYFANGQDQLGLVTFQTWANVDFPINTNFQTNSPNLTSVLSDLVCTMTTSSAMGLNLAYAQIKSLGSAAYASNGVLNVIVFFTDGEANGVTGNFPTKGAADNRYYANWDYGSGSMDMTTEIYTGMPATTSGCQSSLGSASLGTVAQGAGGESDTYATGKTAGIYEIPPTAPTATCASGAVRAICSTSTPLISASSCYFAGSTSYTNTWPIYGQFALRQDVAYLPVTDYYGNTVSNTSYMTQSADLVTGTYAATGRMRVDTPQSLMDASLNTADAQALKIISDTNYKPVIYTIGLGGATDVPDQTVFQQFCARVANDPSSTRYNPSLPTGLFVYSPDDTQLAAAFHQIASQILRLSK